MALVDDLKEAAMIIDEMAVKALSVNNLEGYHLAALARRLRTHARGDEASGAHPLPRGPQGTAAGP